MKSNVLDYLLRHERVDADNARARERLQARAPRLQGCRGGATEVMRERNHEMYEITVGENTDYRIRVFDYRGTLTGTDVRKVLAPGVPPLVDVGLAGREAGHLGTGIIRTLQDCFALPAQAPAARAA
jgi:hypothetical protein